MNESSSSQSPGASTPAAVARSYLESFTRADVDEIASHVSMNFINEHTSALGAGCVGRDAYRERLPGFLRDMVGLEYTIEHLLVDGNSVAAFTTMTARWQDDVPISIRGAQRLVVVDGQIIYRTDYWDSAVFLTQISEPARDALAQFGIG